MLRTKRMSDRMKCFLFCALAFLAVACGDDDGAPAPSVRMDFLEANTDAQGVVASLTTDAGSVLTVAQKITADVADTTYRCVCSYVLDAAQRQADVYSIKHIYSKHPIPASELTERPSDPVKVQSAWKSGGYVNIILGELTTGAEEHVYAFSEDVAPGAASGSDKAVLTVLHARPEGDAPSYTRDVYLSIPLERYEGICGSVEVNIPTYEGVKTFVFEND